MFVGLIGKLKWWSCTYVCLFVRMCVDCGTWVCVRICARAFVYTCLCLRSRMCVDVEGERAHTHSMYTLLILCELALRPREINV